jgi:hypothetical protein
MILFSVRQLGDNGHEEPDSEPDQHATKIRVHCLSPLRSAVEQTIEYYTIL